MSIRDEIKEIYLSEQTPFLTLQDLYSRLPAFNQSSIRSALTRGKQAGEFESAGDGVYFFDFEKYEDKLREEAEEEVNEKKRGGGDIKYGFFRHAKRVMDTNSKSENNFDSDIEMTCQGFAPIFWEIQDIEDVVNPKLLKRSLELITFDGFYLKEDIVNVNVMGSEWRREEKPDTWQLNPEWEVEVKIVTPRGYHNTIHGEFYVHEWK